MTFLEIFCYRTSFGPLVCFQLSLKGVPTETYLRSLHPWSFSLAFDTVLVLQRDVCFVGLVVKVLVHVWCFRGLLSEKPDDSLFFLDVGQTDKAGNEGKGLFAYSRMIQFLLLSRLKVLMVLLVAFLCAEAEPVKAEKGKRRVQRPLRIDLILQHDSMVPAPKK